MTLPTASDSSPPRWQVPAHAVSWAPDERKVWRMPGPLKHREQASASDQQPHSHVHRLPRRPPQYKQGGTSELTKTAHMKPTAASLTRGRPSTFKDLSPEDKRRLSMLIRRLAESELEKQRLAADFDQLQRDHAALMESLAAKQQRVDAETIVGDDLNNGIAPVTTEVPPSPAAKTPLELELKDLKKKFKISATVMKQYHKRISKLQDDRDALLEEMQRIRSELAHPVHDAPSTPATPQSGGSVHSGTTSVLESIMNEIHQLSDLIVSTHGSSSRSASRSPTRSAHPSSANHTPSTPVTHEAAKQSDTATSISLPYTGDGDTSIAAITDDDISRIVDQLAERLELPVSPAKPPPGGQAVLAQPVPALVAPPPMDVPHQSATRALTPSQRTKIGKMLAKSKLEAMETMSIAFTNVHGYGGAEDDIDQDIDRVRVDDAPPPAEISGDTSTSVEQFIQNHLASKSTELLERHRSRPTAQRAVHAPKKARPMNKRTSRGQPVDVTSNFDRAPLADHSHMFKQLPTVARPPSAQKPPQRRASTATGSDVSSVNSVYLFRDDTSMVTSLADLVDELENGDSSGAISGGNVAILDDTNEEQRLLDDLATGLSQID